MAEGLPHNNKSERKAEGSAHYVITEFKNLWGVCPITTEVKGRAKGLCVNLEVKEITEGLPPNHKSERRAEGSTLITEF